MTVNKNPCHPAKPSVPTSHDIGWNTGYAIEAYPPRTGNRPCIRPRIRFRARRPHHGQCRRRPMKIRKIEPHTEQQQHRPDFGEDSGHIAM